MTVVSLVWIYAILLCLCGRCVGDVRKECQHKYCEEYNVFRISLLGENGQSHLLSNRRGRMQDCQTVFGRDKIYCITYENFV